MKTREEIQTFLDNKDKRGYFNSPRNMYKFLWTKLELNTHYSFLQTKHNILLILREKIKAYDRCVKFTTYGENLAEDIEELKDIMNFLNG